MKKTIIYLVLLINWISFSQNQNRIRFEYDEAGNQIRRYMCINCTARIVQETNQGEQNEIIATQFQEDKINYYPNPVKEILNINWELINDINVERIEVYNLSGQLVKKVENLLSIKNTEISFFDLSAGTYILTICQTQQRNKNNKNFKTIKNEKCYIFNYTIFLFYKSFLCTKTFYFTK